MKKFFVKKYKFHPYTACSGDGPAIAEFNLYRKSIKEATGKKPVMIGLTRFFGYVWHITYILK